MKKLALLLLVFSTTLASAEQFRIEPPAPTTRSFVMLRVRSLWGDGCLPRNAQVTRDANVINVHWSLPQGVGCTLAIEDWNDDVEIGVLEPGTYVLRLKVADFPEFKAKTFTVAEASPSVIATPSFASTQGGTQVVFAPPRPDDSFCPPTGGRPPVTLTVDGVNVQQIDLVDCRIIATLPPHAAGPVDVTVRFTDRTYTSRSVLRYVDPSATPDPEVFERVLVPILFSGPGAYGSFWLTDAVLQNRSTQTFSWFSDVSQPHCDGPDCGPRVFPFKFVPLGVFGNRPKGLVLFLPRAVANDVAFGATVIDTSREEEDWGAELRIVRERDARSGSMLFPAVPFDPNYRLMLRLYAIDGGPARFYVYLHGPGEFPRLVVLQPACDTPPCNSSDPAFAAVDLNALFGSVAGRVRSVSVEPDEGLGTRPYWALLSITNNTTQRVTMITPQ